MSQRKIYTIGEAVFDISFKNNVPVSGRPGGSMLNSSVSLGRLGLPVSFVSEAGKDKVGEHLIKFLNQNKVCTEYIYNYQQGKSALALAFLDENNNAEYVFYKDYPKKRLDVNFPAINKNDIVLFGSYFSISTEVRSPLKQFIEKANEKEAIILFDPNFRKSHLSELSVNRKLIDENISFSSIVRGSEEDFKLIYNTDLGKDVFSIIKELGCELLLYTNGDKKVEFWSENLNFSIQVPEIKTISTIGAGDNFNAGLVYWLYKNNLCKDDLLRMGVEQWTEILNIAIKFGSYVCTSYDNYISESFARSLE